MIMDKGFRLIFFLILCLFFTQKFLSQKNLPFSGELIYSIERVDQKDTVRAEMFIYARDSLIRVVNFNSESGKQELIKHLRLGKSYLLIETPKEKFAIRTNEHLEKDKMKNYTFENKASFKIIAGKLARKVKVKQAQTKNQLSFWIHKKIDAKYANVFMDLPGLPLIYYVPTDHGLYKYKLKSIKKSTPPMQLFSFGKEYKIVTFDEFYKEFIDFPESHD
jgi:hypothetical protein